MQCRLEVYTVLVSTARARKVASGATACISLGRRVVCAPHLSPHAMQRQRWSDERDESSSVYKVCQTTLSLNSEMSVLLRGQSQCRVARGVAACAQPRVYYF